MKKFQNMFEQEEETQENSKMEEDFGFFKVGGGNKKIEPKNKNNLSKFMLEFE